MKDPKIVVIGGGTGTFELLSGLKKYTSDLTALVSMADDGGSTGLLRDELGALPPGDVRQALVALARAPQMRELFNYRFEEGSLAGHSFGNLFLTAVEKMSDNFAHAVELASQLLNISGKVLPVTLDNVRIVLTKPDGSEVHGQSAIEEQSHRSQRPQVHLEPRAQLVPEGRQAILEADIVVIAPGSLYGSLAAVLVVDGMAEALKTSAAKKVYVCNLVTERGQSEGFAVQDFADEIERFLDRKIQLDYVFYNTHKPDPALLERYAKEGDYWVEYDVSVLSERHYTAIGGYFVSDSPWQPTAKKDLLPRTFIRHDPDKIAATILQLTKKGMVE